MAMPVQIPIVTRRSATLKPSTINCRRVGRNYNAEQARTALFQQGNSSCELCKDANKGYLCGASGGARTTKS